MGSPRPKVLDLSGLHLKYNPALDGLRAVAFLAGSDQYFVVPADSSIKSYADGIGPNKTMVIPRGTLGTLGDPTSLVRDAHAAGLKVHPWTFRRENYFLPLGDKNGLNPAGHGDLAAEIEAYLKTGIDGLFSDNPREAVPAVYQGAAK